MGNTISLHSNYKGNIELLSMSNIATSVFLEVLVLSGSDLAKTTKEKEFVVWIAQRDQAIVGGGTVGFSIDEMSWSIENFIDEKEFLFSVIDNAILKNRWCVLSYTPNEEIITGCLSHFRSLIFEFQKENAITLIVFVLLAELSENYSAVAASRRLLFVQLHYRGLVVD